MNPENKAQQDWFEKHAAHQRRFYRIGVFILVTGLLAAALVYRRVTAAEGLRSADGQAYLLMPRETKAYEDQMERMGGKANILATELREWFASLWHGRRLAYTLATLAIGGSLVCFFFAHLTTDPPPPDRPAGGKEG
jgi:hypothetical protein